MSAHVKQNGQLYEATPPEEGEEGMQVGGMEKSCELPAAYLHQFPGELIGEKLFFLLVIHGEGFFLLLQGLDFLE